MSPKWAFLAHFGDIFYNVFNRRKSSYLILKPLDFTISCRMDHFNESNHMKLIIFVYFLIIHKNPSVRFWCYRVYFFYFQVLPSPLDHLYTHQHQHIYKSYIQFTVLVYIGVYYNILVVIYSTNIVLFVNFKLSFGQTLHSVTCTMYISVSYFCLLNINVVI